MFKEYAAFIFARGGSKGLPNKNIKIMNGKPLIAWSILAAIENERIGRVIVSTDSDEIAEIAKSYGAEVPFMRPQKLAQDSSPEILSWRHGLEYYVNSHKRLPYGFVSLPTTAPLRSQDDINQCLDLYESKDLDGVITITEAARNPYFNMVSYANYGLLNLVIPSSGKPSRRQDSKEVWDVTTVAYVMNPKFIIAEDYIFSGRIGGVVIPRERAIDIDTAFDFEIAEYLMRQQSDFKIL